MKQDLVDKLVTILGEDNVKQNEPMKKHTTFRVGGLADYFVTPCSVEQVRDTIECVRMEGVPFCIIGNGSNLLVSDEGYAGVVIQLFDKFNQIQIDEEHGECIVQAGALLSKVGMQLANCGLSGFEFATGIPGTIGGAVVMNAGAYGGEIKDCICSAKFLNQAGKVIELSKDEMELGYRSSVAMKKGLVVLEARFSFQTMDKAAILEKIRELSEARRQKQPLEYPSAGSTFKRPEGFFAGKLIQDAGLKGYTVGGAQVSEKHSGFVINTGNATATDIMKLVEDVKKCVYEKFGVMLELEVHTLGNFT